MNGDLSFGNNNIRDINKISKGGTEIDTKLLERVQNICLRHDADFIDFLWEILTSKNLFFFFLIKFVCTCILNNCIYIFYYAETSEYSQMINYIETIFKEILENNFTPQVINLKSY